MVAALFYNGLLLGDLSVPKIYNPLVHLPWRPVIQTWTLGEQTSNSHRVLTQAQLTEYS